MSINWGVSWHFGSHSTEIPVLSRTTPTIVQKDNHHGRFNTMTYSLIQYALCIFDVTCLNYFSYPLDFR